METLIILFIIYSLFQWLFGDNKKKQQQKQRQQQQQRAGQEETIGGAEAEGPQSWEDAMKELESVFSGEPVQKKTPPREQAYQRPEPSSIFQKPERKADIPEISENPFSDHLTAQRASSGGKRTSEMDKLQESYNPIFSDAIGSESVLDEDSGGVSTAQARDILEYLNDRDAAKQAVVMKEILDRPRSYRPYSGMR